MFLVPATMVLTQKSINKERASMSDGSPVSVKEAKQILYAKHSYHRRPRIPSFNFPIPVPHQAILGLLLNLQEFRCQAHET